MHGNSRLPQLGLLVAGAVLILCTAGQSQSTPQRVLGPEAVPARGMEKPNLPGPDSDSIISPDDGPIPNLSILPAGPASPSPADLLSSETMAELLRKLSERFEHIIIDSPPVMAVTDATISSPMVDGVGLVVQGSRTSKASLLRTSRILDASGARILGFVLNKFDHRDGYYGYYYSGEGYYGHPQTRQRSPSDVA